MKITTKGQVTIPKAIRERYGLRPGSEVRFLAHDRQIVLEKAQTDDVWDKYYGYLKGKVPWKRTDDFIRAIRGPGL